VDVRDPRRRRAHEQPRRTRAQFRRKRSFGIQSECGERFAERMMTAVRTARKQCKDVLDFIMVGSITAYIDGTTTLALSRS
jgi:hypothetical protein